MGKPSNNQKLSFGACVIDPKNGETGSSAWPQLVQACDRQKKVNPITEDKRVGRNDMTGVPE